MLLQTHCKMIKRLLPEWKFLVSAWLYCTSVLHPQGKEETINSSGTRGAYYVEEPNSDIFMSYDYPRNDYYW